jgi:hypothetical protein
VTVLYDAGALVAADRSDRQLWVDHRARLELGLVPLTTAPVVAQVSRSTRQVQLRRFLRGCRVVDFAIDVAHQVGSLVAQSRITDVVDVHLVVVAAKSHAAIITSDAPDIERVAASLAEPVVVLQI